MTDVDHEAGTIDLGTDALIVEPDVAKLDDCHDRGCQREEGHPPPHASRYWNAQTSSEVVQEWVDGGEVETFQ